MEYKASGAIQLHLQPSTFFRKYAGGRRGLHYVMDYDLWIRLARSIREFVSAALPSHYRLHEESKTISPKASLRHHKEALEAVRKYTAGLNRVYMYCYHILNGSCLCPCYIRCSPWSSCLCLVVLSATKNELEDLKMIKPSNIRKLFMDWMDIYRKY